jgi:uncharacterized membrane protein YfcA
VLAAYLGSRALQVVFAVLLVVIGVQMLATASQRLRAERRERIAMAAKAA